MQSVISVARSILKRKSPEDLLSSIAAGAAAAFLIHGFGMGLTYLTQVLFARWLGAADYGAYAYAFSWAQLLAVLSGLGMATGVLRFVPTYLAKRDWGLLRGVLNRSRQVALGAGVVVAAAGSFLFLSVTPDGFNPLTIMIGLWIVPILACSNVLTEIVRGTKRIALAYTPPMIFQPLLAAGTAYLVLSLSGNLSSVFAMSATGVSFLVVLAIQLLSLRWALPGEARGAVPAYQTSEWLRVSLPLLLIQSSAMLLRKGDILMIGALIGQREVGFYDAASKTAMLVSFLLTAVNAIAAPTLASLYASEDRSSMQRMVSASARWVYWPSLLMTLLLVIFAKPVLSLFGPEFASAHWVLRLLALGQLVNAATGPVGYLMSLTGHHNLSARVIGLSALLNIVLNGILIPIWGIVGAALATMATTVLKNLWLYVLVKRRLGIRSIAFASS